MRKPSFVLVGAPKCGTTSVAHWLGKHPDVFVSDPKEPNYFARHLTIVDDVDELPPWQQSLEGYLSLFERSDEESAVGEASTRYLRSSRALEELKAWQPEAKVIVGLRNPVDLVRSWHSQKLHELQETERDFERAWRLEPERRQGSKLPPGLRAKDAVFYRKVGAIGSQLERVTEIFGEENVLVYFLDDLASSPRSEFRRILEFLGCDLDLGGAKLPAKNVSRSRNRSIVWLTRVTRRMLRRLPPSIQADLRRMKGAEWIDRLWRWMKRGPVKPVPISPAFERELAEAYEGEREKIEAITGRNLGHWRDGDE